MIVNFVFFCVINSSLSASICLCQHYLVMHVTCGFVTKISMINSNYYGLFCLFVEALKFRIHFHLKRKQKKKIKINQNTINNNNKRNLLQSVNLSFFFCCFSRPYLYAYYGPKQKKNMFIIYDGRVTLFQCLSPSELWRFLVNLIYIVVLLLSFWFWLLLLYKVIIY